MGGTANLGADYSLTGAAGQVTIPAGQTFATVTLHAISDSLKERKESATMVLRAGTGYKLPSRPKAVLTIANGP